LKVQFRSFMDTLESKKGFEKIIELFTRVLSLIIFLIIYIVLLIIEPFKKVRIGFLYNRRFGHLALNTDIHLRNLQLGAIPKDRLYIFFAFKPANNQLLKMFKRKMNIVESEFLSKLVSPICFFNTRFCQRLPFEANEYREFNEANATLEFTKDEELVGKSELKKMGIGENDWFVCMFARDDQYAKTAFPTMDHSPDEHRNADIDDYNEAVKFIVEQGGFVIRMGSNVAKEFTFKHPKVIDYAVYYRNDFMDIYLPAHCRFYLGTSSGGVEIVKVFDRPQVAVNWMPIGSATFGKNDIFIPKNVVYKESGISVPFAVQMKLLGNILVSFGDAPEEILSSNGMLVKNNTPDEILEVVKEMYNRVNGNHIVHEEYNKKFKEYHDILSDADHWCKNVKTPLGQTFLLKMKLHA